MLDTTDTHMVLDIPTTDKFYLNQTSKYTAKYPLLVPLISDQISVLDIIFADR